MNEEHGLHVLAWAVHLLCNGGETLEEQPLSTSRMTTVTDGMPKRADSPMQHTKRQLYFCTKCSYHTPRRNNLKRHKQVMHKDLKQPLECCDQQFFSKAAHRSHIKSAHKSGYKCIVCQYVFSRKTLLKRHYSVHNGRKDFLCKFCSYATSHKSNLQRHLLVHFKNATALNIMVANSDVKQECGQKIIRDVWDYGSTLNYSNMYPCTDSPQINTINSITYATDESNWDCCISPESTPIVDSWSNEVICVEYANQVPNECSFSALGHMSPIHMDIENFQSINTQESESEPCTNHSQQACSVSCLPENIHISFQNGNFPQSETKDQEEFYIPKKLRMSKRYRNANA